MEPYDSVYEPMDWCVFGKMYAVNMFHVFYNSYPEYHGLSCPDRVALEPPKET